MIRDVVNSFLMNAKYDLDKIKVDKLPISTRIEIEKAKVEIKNAQAIINQYSF